MSKGEDAEDEVKPLIRKKDMGLRALPQEYPRGHTLSGRSFKKKPDSGKGRANE